MKIIFTLFIVQGGMLKLDVTVLKANVLTYISSFSENLENSRKLILWCGDCTLTVHMSNKNENNFYIISCPWGFLTLDIMIWKANVLTYIWSFSENLEHYRKLIL